MDVETLHRPIYALPAAAEILGVPRSTLRWWLDGGTVRGRAYPPVIRPEPTGDSDLTWAEFVEAGLLSQYRRSLGVKLSEIRVVVAALRDEYGIPCPLAHNNLWVGEGPRILMRLQDTHGLSEELWLVAVAAKQPLLLPPADAFVKRVEWSDNDLAAAWRPHDDERSPVRCRPGRRFGRPAIRGVSTSAIVEHIDGGESENDVADQFDLGVDHVRWALAYEISRRAPAAA